MTESQDKQYLSGIDTECYKAINENIPTKSFYEEITTF